MKLLAIICLLVLVTEGLTLGYHQDVGIPAAARIRQKETAEITSRIIGGLPSQTGDNPHLAGLLITLSTGQMSVCSGTVLSRRKVLTAAQCWYDGYSQGRTVQVVVGSTRLFYGNRYDVTGISVHPQFDAKKLANDLAMLTTSYEMYFYDYVKPALLPSLSEVNNTFAGVSARVSGYGKTSDWSAIGANTQQNAVTVPVLGANYYDCNYLLPLRPNYDNSVICTSGDNGWGTCGADLGGPLVIEDYYNQTVQYNQNQTFYNNQYNSTALLIGVTSIQSPFGCQLGFATGYMRVTAYLSWILRNM